MKKQLLATAALLMAASLTACMNTATSATDLPPGEYQKTTTSTDSNGTAYTSESDTTVKKDANGHKTAKVKTKTTKDPKGLLNKETTSESETTIKK